MTSVVPSASFYGRFARRCFGDGRLSIELHVKPLDMPSALGGTAPAMDRGHGRCSICGQTLTESRPSAVTRLSHTAWFRWGAGD